MTLEEAYQMGYRCATIIKPGIVRCKDCKHRGDKRKRIIAFVAEKQEMPFHFYDNNGDWFCADGERRDAE